MIRSEGPGIPKIAVCIVVLCMLGSSFIILSGASSLESKLTPNSGILPANGTGRDQFGSSGGLEPPSPADVTVYPWPMHLHDELHRSFTQAPAPLASDLLWYNFTGSWTYGSPAIAEGKVFIGARNATWDYMFAFYQKNGTLAWKTETTLRVAGGRGVTSSPAYSNGVVFFGGDRIYALYADTGAVKWTVPTGNGNWGDGTPTVADGKVFIGGSNWRMYNIEEDTGNVLWTFQTQSTGGANYGLYAAPAVYNGHIYVAACDGWVYQILIDQPGPVAVANHSFFTGYAMYGSPVIFDGKVYIGNGYTSLNANRRFYALDAIDLSVVWEFYPGAPTSFLSSAAIAYDKLYVGSVDGNLYVLDPYGSGGTTTVIWQYLIGTTWSSPAIASGQVFIGSKSNYLYAFDANQSGPPSYKWRYNMNGAVDSSPAVSDGRVYVGTHGNGGRVYCFGDPGDIVPPSPISFSPIGTGVPIDTNFVVEWSEAMNWTSVEHSFSFTDGSTVWDYSWGTFTHDPLTNTSTFDPFGDLSLSTTYWVTFDSSAVDISGNPLDGNGDGTGGDALTWSFTTVTDSPPLLDLLQPGFVPGQSFTAGSVVSIQWLASDDNPWPSFGNVVNMSYGPTTAGGTPIAANEFEDGIYPWDTSTVIPGTYYVNISVYDSAGQTAWDHSDFSFTIFPPSFPPWASLVQPAGGESWTGGATIDIIWLMGDDNTPDQNLVVYLNYSYLLGQGPIAGPLTGLSSPFIYPWTLPIIDGTDVVVEIDVIDEDGLLGSNLSNEFEIDSTPPSVFLTTPDDGEQNVPTNIVLQTTWSEMMNTDATNSSFTLVDNATWTPVTGQINWVGSVFSFDPNSDLAAGNWYTANFSASARDDSDPGNTLPSTYSWSFATAISPDNTPPEISDVQTNPSPGEVYLPVNISARIEDAYGIGEAHVQIDNPIGAPIGNFSMSFDVGTSRYYFVRSYDELGSYFCSISARDNNGNWNSTVCWLAISDSTAPTISDVTRTPDPQEVYSSVNVSAIVSDNYQLQQVRIDLQDPLGGAGNFAMNYDSTNGRFYYTQIYDLVGTYTCLIWAWDTSSNQDSSNCDFDIVDTTRPSISDLTEIPDPAEVYFDVNVSAIVTDNYQLQDVLFNVRDPYGATIGNYTMSYDSANGRYYTERNYSQLGNHTFDIWAGDSSDNWNTLSRQFEIVDTTPPQITHTSPANVRVRTEISIQAIVTDNHQVNSSWLNYTDASGYHFNVSMSHLGGDSYQLTIPSQSQEGQVVYHIWAVDEAGNGVATSTYVIQVYDPVPNPPTDLSAERSSDGQSVDLSWVAPSTNVDGSAVDDLSGYYIYRSDSTTPPDTPLNPGAPVSNPVYVDNDVEPGRTYHYWVTAVDQAGHESELSALATASVVSDDYLLFAVVLIAVFVLLLVVLALVLILGKRRKKGKEIPEEPAGDESVEEETGEQEEG